MVLALVALMWGGVAVASAVTARHRAQAAADLAALSAAYRIAAGHAAACGTADYVATAMGARVADCAVDGLDVQVRTTVAVPTVGPATGPASAVARAGPVDPAP
ncbi:hypothetical protein MVAC_09517 [Mycolicibacterium vaccae ATCC 25954]|jgi:secretion/DNA translocation related TadE-like protein|uniref:Putative Flp pilus-assembly TadG-like N-terminal domain-containing protein n=2 Tax=Mycolicibacterium vaccae TaxID=1810 RepID=K0UUF3_MYCVA|nr:hypothetical protein MYVA_5293 [Mycolicibacterium vaccae 95051]EJZ10401.1 hypothetical protein MVAC_09517 [Mycolicibacterium vaccae ATCC 25954]